MLKKIFFYINFNFVFFSIAQSAETEGMPQLNTEFWVSQIFWLILTFGGLFIILSKFILPKISSNLEIRKAQILENIETAEKQKEAAESKDNEYEKIILNTKNEAKNYFTQAREKILKDIEKKRYSLESEINEEIKVAENEINNLKKSSPEKINKIAIEASADLIKQITGLEVNNSSITAIVEDLSKKNKDKLYEI